MITKPTTYTEKLIEEKIREMFSLIEKKEDIFHLDELLAIVKIPRQRYYEALEKYKANEELIEKSDILKQFLEMRIVKGALN